jgi:hypothetical protein
MIECCRHEYADRAPAARNAKQEPRLVPTTPNCFVSLLFEPIETTTNVNYALPCGIESTPDIGGNRIGPHAGCLPACGCRGRASSIATRQFPSQLKARQSDV